GPRNLAERRPHLGELRVGELRYVGLGHPEHGAVRMLTVMGTRSAAITSTVTAASAIVVTWLPPRPRLGRWRALLRRFRHVHTGFAAQAKKERDHPVVLRGGTVRSERIAELEASSGGGIGHLEDPTICGSQHVAQ